jgi:hypothetical protein
VAEAKLATPLAVLQQLLSDPATSLPVTSFLARLRNESGGSSLIAEVFTTVARLFGRAYSLVRANRQWHVGAPKKNLSDWYCLYRCDV